MYDKFKELYPKVTAIINGLEIMGFSDEEIESIMENYELEKIEPLLDKALNDKMNPLAFRETLKLAAKKENSIDKEELIPTIEPIAVGTEETIASPIPLDTIYAPSFNPVEENIDYSKYITNYRQNNDVVEALEKQREEKTTSSLVDYVYKAIEPEGMSTINLKGIDEKPVENVVNHNTSASWVENGQYVSVDDLKESLSKFYKEHKKDKYEILMPDGRIVKFKISKQNIKQLQKRIQETTQIMLDERKKDIKIGKPDDRYASISHLDENNKGTVDVDMTTIHLGNVRVGDYKNLTPGRYVPVGDAKQSLVGIFRKVEPIGMWGLVRDTLTSLSKEKSVIDRAIEGSKAR